MALPILPVVKRMAKSAAVRIKSRPDRRFKKPNVKDFKSDMQRVSEDLAEEFKKTIIQNIEQNVYGFRLDDSTIRRKNSDIPLIDTKQMVKAIYRKGTTVSVKDSPHSGSSLTNRELAIVHEYGTKDKGIPSRPVWRNTFRDFKKTAKKRVLKFLKTKKFSHGRSNH